MTDQAPAPAAVHQAAAGLLQCLEMLAEEADNLHLSRTLLALRKAIRACQAEQTRGNVTLRPRPRRMLMLH